MWFIGVEVEQETSAPPPKKNPGSAPVAFSEKRVFLRNHVILSDFVISLPYLCTLKCNSYVCTCMISMKIFFHVWS